MWYPGSGVVLNCIDSSSLPSFLLYLMMLYPSANFDDIDAPFQTLFIGKRCDAVEDGDDTDDDTDAD